MFKQIYEVTVKIEFRRKAVIRYEHLYIFIRKVLY